MHSLLPSRSGQEQTSQQHNVFLGLTGESKGRVFCLPDDYEVFDASLNDIQFNL
jgi:hypothetical protein